MSDTVIWHNPKCGTSRNVLAMIRNAGVELVIRDYQKDAPDEAELRAAMAAAKLTPHQLVRRKGTPFAELGLSDATPDDDLVAAMLAHPILIERPLVFTPKGAALCRPSEAVLDLLPQQQGAFSKEDGEPVVDAQGNRVR
ncbi:MAG: arsenate reductase (glutaredoxin) [Paracoccus sp. (in: a-proteobacteria)]|uniref:arsenate reductase (glutaredoxin) n=1 Tax=Paracoccus sp. TaxID=267 RepID=UPI0026DF09E8|nr:arsenate reductase (glutaredoxin) [Paracoccus sp. (in: a-proteobacteria)]MDO5622117.1 arsenate reductase (glutaredoxin) [Paracoccus sp. (in: a-proteobacteria)]